MKKASFATAPSFLFASIVLAVALHGQAPQAPSPQTAAIDPAESPVQSSDISQYAVILRAPSLAAALAQAQAQGHAMSDEEQRAYSARLRAAQDQIASRLTAAGAKEITRVGKALNAIFVAADAAATTKISAIEGVRSVQAVLDLQTQASPAPNYKEVVPAIRADTLQSLGIDGSGVRVAVLDSGIDYTHAALGGAGTIAAYRAAYGVSQLSPENKRPVAWPQGRVIGGYDFIGEQWPYADLRPDPNPIAAPPAGNELGIVGTDGSHGTSVADILAGQPFPGRPDNHGVAPGALLYAVKVCSAVVSSCNGIAMVQGIEWALDPDGDGSLSDAVDVINMSLGGNFGQKENPAAEAAANAARIGVVVCCAAGNGGDSPYILNSPASAPEVISVAQTSMPSDRVYRIELASNMGSPSSIPFTNTVQWAPVVGTTTGPLVEPVSAGGCAPIPLGSLIGKIALIERLNCNVSFKVAYAQEAGAIGVIIANNAPGDPPTFSFGGIPPDLPEDFAITIPVLVVGQAEGSSLKNRLRSGEALTATFSASAFIDTSSNIVSTSSRGPSITYNALKPEIAAPGANLGALSGSGTEFAVLGGTSGATPVIAGTAALLRQRFPRLSPLEVKARMMNNAQLNIFENSVTAPGQYASLTRVGAGEVRAEQAVRAEAAAWVLGANGAADLPALSFGYWRLSAIQSFTKTIRVKNDANSARTFTLSTTTRFASGEPDAVTLSSPGSVSVAAHATADVNVTLTVDPAKLPAWSTDSGQYGADGPKLTAQEFGGFIILADATDTLRLPWHIMPHRAHRATISTSTYKLGTPAPILTNTPSSTTAPASLFALTGVSPRLPAGSYPAASDGFALTDLQYVGVRLVDYGPPYGPGLEFAITTWDRHTLANYPAFFEVAIDVNNDGTPDWYLFNQRVSIAAADWRNATYLQGATWSVSYPTFFTNTDFNSANVILQVPLNRIGASVPLVPSPSPVANPISPTQPITFTIQVFDNYFTGLLNDEIGPMVYTPAAPKYAINGALGNILVPPGGSVPVPITSTGLTGSPSQSGILLMYQNARTRYESQTVKVTP